MIMKKNPFRRGMAGLLAAGTLVAAMPVLHFSAASQTMVGDANLDGAVTAADIVELQSYLFGKASFDETKFANCDLVADGKVNAFDLAMLKKKMRVTPPETTTGTVAKITYSESSVTLYDASGNVVSPDDAVAVNGTEVTIKKAGEYEVNGTSASGRLVVSTDDTAEPEALVQLNLTGLTLTNATMAPIFVENVGDECVISVKNGSVNTIADGTSHTDIQTNSEGVAETINGALYACDDLKIKGKGTLIVKGNTADGIVCKNDLKIWNGTIQVTAVDDGIRGNDSVRIGDPDDTDYTALNVSVTTTAGDGITSTNAEETDKGFVRVSGGSVTVNSYGDGIQGEQAVEINGGTLDITTYQGSSYTGSGSSSGSTGSTGGWGGGMGGMEGGNTNKTDFSCKGIKAVGIFDEAGTTWQSAGNLTITGGTIKVNATDDALHCGGDMVLTGGVMNLQSADDAMHSDHNLTIGTNGNANVFDDVQVYVPFAYEGVEALNIYQYSGTVYTVTTDDGYNAAGGADSSGGSWAPGGMGSTGGGSYSLNISGGLAVVNSASGDHDGFDSNGSINMTGGYVGANGQEPADCDGTKNMSGACYITINRGGNTNLTTRYSFLDSTGNVIVSFLSASGGSATTTNGVTSQTGGTVSGGTQLMPECIGEVYIGGTLSGGTTGGNTGNMGW
ncbi:MAG: carbohydrate-binding domain-containing protein [Ruminococcus sp.]|nr:carbohydrate-binding domain-containing protein [Ruminococcus sp.]